MIHFLTVFVIFASTNAIAKNWSEVYESTKKSIPIINQAGAVCSGFLYTEDTSLTAAHCIDGFRSTYIRYGNLESRAIIVAVDRANDLALLRHARFELKPLVINSKPILVGSSLASIGHPTTSFAFSNPIYDEDFTYLLSTGILSKQTENILVSDMSLSPGNSGGPVINKDGEVLGIVSRKRIDPGVGNIGIATSAKPVQEFATKNQNNFRALNWRNASHRFFTRFGVDSLSFEVDGKEENFSILQLYFGWSLWQRIDLRFNLPINSVYNEDGKLYMFALQFPVEFELSNHSFFAVNPLFGIANFNDTQYNMLGLAFEMSAIPLSLVIHSYHSKDADISKMSSLSIQFGTSF